MDFEDVRLWSVRFQNIRTMETLPSIHEIVLERQLSAMYHLEGRNRLLNETQIVCTIEGEGAFRYDGTIYRLTPGKAFMSTLGDPSSAYYYPGHAKKPWIFIWASFVGRTAVDMINEFAEIYGRVVDLPLDSGFVAHLRAQKMNETHSIRFVTPAEGAKIVTDIIASLGETLESGIKMSRQNKLVNSAKMLIMQNADRSLNLESIAEKLNVSREHLSRVFVDVTGMPPAMFANKERMHLAARLLRDRSMDCRQIALKTGFTNSSSFARAFKHYYHISPTEYQLNSSMPPDELIKGD